MTIATDALPTPSRFAIVPGQVRRLTPSRSRIVIHDVPDPANNARRFLFYWNDTRIEVADALRQHADQHGRSTFTLKIPKSGEHVTARWANAGPRISLTSAIAASVTAEFEEVLAHE